MEEGPTPTWTPHAAPAEVTAEALKVYVTGCPNGSCGTTAVSLNPPAAHTLPGACTATARAYGGMDGDGDGDGDTGRDGGRHGACTATTRAYGGMDGDGDTRRDDGRHGACTATTRAYG